jgi:2,3,4,5-tetrahydropyridine-2,6-dicarboxylate N-succinyltransferase
MNQHDVQNTILAAWDNRDLLQDQPVRQAIEWVIEELDKGRMRVAEPTGTGDWKVNEWIKKAVILYFPIRTMEVWESGPMEFYDKMLLKHDYASLGVRVVPHAVARYGAYLANGVILMPSYTTMSTVVPWSIPGLP